MNTDYLRILQETDYDARGEYEDPATALVAIKGSEDVDQYGNIRTGTADPRIAFAHTRNEQGEVATLDRSMAVKHSGVDEKHPEIADIPTDDTTMPVQDQPDMIARKRTVIIDTSVRDWTVQPDAYSNIFSFGAVAASSASNLTAQVPYYYNNPTIPLSAYETTRTALSNVASTGKVTSVTNNKSQVFLSNETIPPSFISLLAGTIVRPTYGWKFVTSNGLQLHSPDAYIPTDPNVRISYFPAYNARETQGSLIGIDTYPGQQTNNNIFSTQLPLSNITDLRLQRATLPIRGNQPYDTSVFDGGSIMYPDSMNGKPYILMNIQNMPGQYFGGSYTAQKSFSVLTQNMRMPQPGGVAYPSQFTDYYSFSNESYIFDPPMSQLSNANIQLYDSGGTVLSQLDNLQVVDMIVYATGKIQFFVTQNVLQTARFTDTNLFAQSDIRVGDEIKFYAPVLTRILADAQLTPALSGLFTLLSNSVLVTDICANDFPVNYILPTQSVGSSFFAVPKISGGFAGISNTFVAISNAVNNLSQICLQQYGIAVGSPSFCTTRTLAQDYPLPIMNKNMQACYTLAVSTLEPNMSNFKKIIPN